MKKIGLLILLLSSLLFSQLLDSRKELVAKQEFPAAWGELISVTHIGNHGFQSQLGKYTLWFKKGNTVRAVIVVLSISNAENVNIFIDRSYYLNSLMENKR